MGQLLWMDATVHQPKEGAILMVIEHKNIAISSRVARIAAGFYEDDEYFIGDTGQGGPLDPEWKVTFWATPVWPSGYDQEGCWLLEPLK